MAKSGDKNNNMTLWPLITMASPGVKCYKNLSECPPGHEMENCKLENGDSGKWCKQCGDLTFQPNTNRYGDQCRMRRTCDKYRMKFQQYGDTTRNAECVCELGNHFENEDQRACVPNKECGKGLGQGIFGICENCIEKNMYSDSTSRHERCKPLRNCEKESRCTIEKSNGTSDNKCGPVVSDVTDCDSIVDTYRNPPNTASSNTGLILGAVFGVLGVLVLIILVLWLVRRRNAQKKMGRLTQEELDEMLAEIIKRSKKDELYCKKVLTIAQREVEDRINNQIWALPQELFRNHIEPAKYEVLLEKYKEKQHKFAINGYLQDWRSWRGDTSEAVEEMINCLKCDKVKREDIVYETVMKLREDYPEVVAGYSPNNRSSKPGSQSFCAVLFPCACADDEESEFGETKETSSRLLDAQQTVTVNETDNKHVTQSPPPDWSSGQGGGNGGDLSPTEAGIVYRQQPMPSAPALLEDDEDVCLDTRGEVKGTHFLDRSDSLPVQASS